MLTIVDDPLVVQRANDLVLAVTTGINFRKASLAMQKALHKWYIKIGEENQAIYKAKDGAIDFGHAIKFGFTQYTVNDNYWFDYEFDEKEIYLNVEKPGRAKNNYIEIAQTPNGKYVTGIVINLETRGSIRGTSIHDSMYYDPCDALKHGMNWMRSFAERSPTSAMAKKIIKRLNEIDIEFELSKIGLITSPQPTTQTQQLSLF